MSSIFKLFVGGLYCCHVPSFFFQFTNAQWLHLFGRKLYIVNYPISSLCDKVSWALVTNDNLGIWCSWLLTGNLFSSQGIIFSSMVLDVCAVCIIKTEIKSAYQILKNCQILWSSYISKFRWYKLTPIKLNYLMPQFHFEIFITNGTW